MNAGRIGMWTVVGICIGAAMGAASGNMGLWVAAGVAIGLSSGVASERRKRK
jgi:hypothetical protein